VGGRVREGSVKIEVEAKTRLVATGLIASLFARQRSDSETTFLHSFRSSFGTLTEGDKKQSGEKIIAFSFHFSFLFAFEGRIQKEITFPLLFFVVFLLLVVLDKSAEGKLVTVVRVHRKELWEWGEGSK